MNDQQRRWCNAAVRHGGSFVRSFAETMFCADDDNTLLLLPVLDRLMEKYPKYLDPRLTRLEDL